MKTALRIGVSLAAGLFAAVVTLVVWVLMSIAMFPPTDEQCEGQMFCIFGETPLWFDALTWGSALVLFAAIGGAIFYITRPETWRADRPASDRGRRSSPPPTPLDE